MLHLRAQLGSRLRGGGNLSLLWFLRNFTCGHHISIGKQAGITMRVDAERARIESPDFILATATCGASHF